MEKVGSARSGATRHFFLLKTFLENKGSVLEDPFKIRDFFENFVSTPKKLGGEKDLWSTLCYKTPV